MPVEERTRRVSLVRRHNRGEILRGNGPAIAIIRRAVDKAYRDGRRFRSAISGSWMNLQLRTEVLAHRAKTQGLAKH